MPEATVTRRVFFSMNADVHLSEEQNALKWGIVEQAAGRGYAPEIFTPPPERRIRGLARRIGWTFDAVERVMRRCSGHIIIGQPRWRVSDGEGDALLPTEFHHYEGALSYTLRLPTLVLADRRLVDRIVFDGRMGRYIVPLPEASAAEWLAGDVLRSALDDWDDEMKRRRDVFLGYSSGSRGIARNLKMFIETQVGAAVLDWHDDFASGDFILSQIKDAAERCSGGIFLFTKDDAFEGGQGKAAPRDNVVFEAGYFASAKGQDRVLIILEAGAKMPADLGGHIYVALDDRTNLEPVERRVRAFFKENL